MGTWFLRIEQGAERNELTSPCLGELHELAEGTGRPPLIPADADLSGGTLAVRDRQGNLIGAYRLVEGDLALALEMVELTPIDPGDVPP